MAAVSKTPGSPGLDGDDLVGLEVDQALARARASGYEVGLVWTSPPWPGAGGGATRVVRVRRTGPARLEFAVAREEYSRGHARADR